MRWIYSKRLGLCKGKWIPQEGYSCYAKSLTQTVGCGVAKYSPGRGQKGSCGLSTKHNALNGAAKVLCFFWVFFEWDIMYA